MIHDRQIAHHGGASRLRDPGLLEGGCHRRLNRFASGEERITTFGATYALGIAKAGFLVEGQGRPRFHRTLSGAPTYTG